MSNEKALTYTKKLQDLLIELNDIYEKSRKEKEEYDFYTIIEPFVNETQKLSSDWRKSINAVISNSSSYFIGERQLDQIEDNIAKLSVQAFQYASSYKLFKQYLQSTQFLLKTIARQL